MTKYKKVLEYKKIYNENRKHPCAICGAPCSYRSTVCKNCHKKDGKGVERTKQWREIHKHPCKECGALCDYRSKIFISCYRKHQKAGGIKDKYCLKCGAILALQNISGYCSDCYKGDIVYNWKGGRRTSRKGYIYIRCQRHHRATTRGFVFEHILIWEHANGKMLPDGWVIHHLNGIKTDNRPKNLVALSSQKHCEVLAAKAKRIQELEALLNGQHQLL